MVQLEFLEAKRDDIREQVDLLERSRGRRSQQLRVDVTSPSTPEVVARGVGRGILRQETIARKAPSLITSDHVLIRVVLLEDIQRNFDKPGLVDLDSIQPLPTMKLEDPAGSLLSSVREFCNRPQLVFCAF